MNQELLAHDTPDSTTLRQFLFKPTRKFSCTPIRINMVRIIKANVNPHRIVSPPSHELPEEPEPADQRA
jgi:hypothetical protein